MRRTSLLGTVLSVSAAGVLWSSGATAQTQPWLEDRRYTEGRGIQVGDFELHPGVAAEFGYDSNFFLRSDEEDPVGALRLRITPSFSISSLGPQRRADGATPDYRLRAGIHATYDEFFPVSGEEAGQDAMADQRNLTGRLDASVDILPGKPVFGSLRGGFTRTLNPTNVGDPTRSFNRLIPTAGAEIGFAPGGGLFDWRFGYQFTGVFFESSDYSNLSNLNHELSTRGRWRFLPRSAITFDGRFGFLSFPDGTQKTSSHPMRARLGYNGLITPSFSLLAMAGWGASFYEPAGQEDFDSVIGQLELKWFITPSPSEDPAAATLALSSLALGFTRDFVDAYIGTYLEQNRGYLKFSHFFAQRFLLVADAGAAAVVFPDIPQPAQASFTAARVDATLFGEYRFTDYFGLNATLRYDHFITDVDLGGVVGGFDALQYQVFQALLGARFLL